MRALCGGLSILIAALASATPASACQCHERRDVAGEYARAGIVFTGTATRDLRVSNGIGSTGFEVGRVIKGEVPARIGIQTGGAGSCGFRFVGRASYLVYAWRTGGSGWYTNICSRTTELASGMEDLALLETMQTRPAGGASK